MYVLKGARMGNVVEQAARRDGDVPRGESRNGALGEAPTVIYLDRRPLTRDCVGGWLRRSLSGFGVHVLPDPDQIETTSAGGDQIQAVVINAGPERISSTAVTRLISRVSELLPDAPIAVLSDHEDADSVREAFEL